MGVNCRPNGDPRGNSTQRDRAREASRRMKVDPERIAELTLAGWTIKHIARELGCHPGTVSRHRTRLGIARVFHGPVCSDPHIAARVAMMTTAGWSAQRIADTLNCHARTVTRIRVRLGIARPHSRWLTPDEVAWAERLLDDGCSISEVERTMGRAAGSLHRRFQGRGWTHQELSEFGAFCSGMARRQRKLS